MCVAALIFFLCGISIHGNANKTGAEQELTGVAVAYDYVKSLIPCHNKECDGSLIVRIEGRDQSQPIYVRIDFRFKPGKPPRKLVEGKREWRFKVIRTSDLDEPIYEFIQYEKDRFSEERKSPNWRFIPGAERESLPFGDTLQSYSLVKNGFTQITKK